MSERLHLRGTKHELYEALDNEGVRAALAATEHIRGKMLAYQYALLHRLAGEFDGGRILEIGCFYGRSALVMAMGAPRASLTTMSPERAQVSAVRLHRKGHKIEVLCVKSWDLLKRDTNVWGMVYVDGNHHEVERDLPWFNRLREGGLMLFHDYTGADAEKRGHSFVCKAVDGMGEKLGREPDVLVIDDTGIGMAGFYRGKGERW